MVSKAEEALVICCICTFIGVLFICLRCHSRFFIIRKWGVEDILIISALPFSLAFTIMVDYGRRRGTGTRSSDLPPKQASEIMMSLFVCIITYNIGLTLTKISILAQMLHFFFQPRQRLAIWIFIGIICCYATAGAFATFFACIPLQYFWDRTLPGGHCYDYGKGWYVMSAVNILTDLAICILPIPMLKYLKLPPRQKYGLMFVFALGGFTCIVAALRFPSIIRLARDDDASWNFFGPSVWSSVELNTGIVCACLPNLRPLISRLFPRLLSSSTPSTNHSCMRNKMRDWIRRNTNVNIPINHVHIHNHGHKHDRHRPRSRHEGQQKHNNMNLTMNGLGPLGADDDDDFDYTTANDTRMSATLVHTPNLCRCIPDQDAEKLAAPSQPTEIDSFDKLAVAYGTKYEWSITADPNPYPKKR